MLLSTKLVTFLAITTALLVQPTSADHPAPDSLPRGGGNGICFGDYLYPYQFGGFGGPGFYADSIQALKEKIDPHCQPGEEFNWDENDNECGCVDVTTTTTTTTSTSTSTSKSTSTTTSTSTTSTGAPAPSPSPSPAQVLDLTVFDGGSSSEAQKRTGATSVLQQAGVTEDKTYVAAGMQFSIDDVAACADLGDGSLASIRSNAIDDYQPAWVEVKLKTATATCINDDTADADRRRRRQADGVDIQIELVYAVTSADPADDLAKAAAVWEDVIADQIKDAIITVVTAAGKSITVNVATTEVDEVTFSEILDTFLEDNGRIFEFVTADEPEPEMKNAESSSSSSSKSKKGKKSKSKSSSSSSSPAEKKDDGESSSTSKTGKGRKAKSSKSSKSSSDSAEAKMEGDESSSSSSKKGKKSKSKKSKKSSSSSEAEAAAMAATMAATQTSSFALAGMAAAVALVGAAVVKARRSKVVAEEKQPLVTAPWPASASLV